MNNNNEQAARVLNDLIASCHDAEEGYAKAAKGVHDDAVSTWLTGISAERERFAAELAQMVTKLAQQPASDAHYGGILHRGWVDLETRIRPKDQHDLLLDCMRGDEGTLKHYDHALQQALPDDARRLVETQRTQIQADLEYLSGILAGKHAPEHA